jgi:hypothetical protein
LSFENYHPKNNVRNQDGNHDDNKVRVTIYFFELTDNDGQNFLAGIVQETWRPGNFSMYKRLAAAVFDEASP